MFTSFLFGIFLSLLLIHSSWILRQPWVDILSSDEFEKTHADKPWIFRLMRLNLFIWIVLFIVLIPIVLSILKDYISVFTFSFWFIGGICLLDGLVEVFTCNAPQRIVSTGRGGSSGVIRVASGKLVRLFGLGHIILTIVIGLILPLILKFGADSG